MLCERGFILISLQPRLLQSQDVNASLKNGNKIKADNRALERHESSVISHVQAHLSSGGSLVSSPSYLYTTTTEGSRFISSGDVSFKMYSVNNDPSAQIELAKSIEKAALAPIDPTPHDRSVSVLAQTLGSHAQRVLKAQLEKRIGENVNTSA